MSSIGMNGNQWEQKVIIKEHFLKMVSDLISVFPDSTNILDPYMGSGTVAVVAKALGKNYIGFEIDKNYIDIANQRINNSDLLTPS